MRKILIVLAILGFLLLPLIAFCQVTFTSADCVIRHNLNDYKTCCFWDYKAGDPKERPADMGHPDRVPPFWRCLGPEHSAQRTDYWSGEFGRDLSSCCLIEKTLTIGDWIFTAILVVAVIIFLLAAWSFLISQGDPNKVKTARNYLIYAIIGIAVAFLAKVLVRVVASIMT